MALNRREQEFNKKIKDFLDSLGVYNAIIIVDDPDSDQITVNGKGSVVWAIGALVAILEDYKEAWKAQNVVSPCSDEEDDNG